jgi:uncharacterized SAM-binding protein YcdF (DUF218 family)
VNPAASGQNRLADGPMLPPPSARRSGLRVTLAAFVLGLSIAVLAAAQRPLLVGFARLFRVDDPAPADAIVLLMGGWFTRPLRAAELYRDGLAPTVLLSATEPIPYPDLCESALNRKVLIHAGVPSDRIAILPRETTSTREEALQVRDYVSGRPIRRVIVVTTAFHTARARWIFRKVLRGTGVEVRTAAAEDPRFNESNWYTNRGLLVYLQEAPKRLFYQLVY